MERGKVVAWRTQRTSQETSRVTPARTEKAARFGRAHSSHHSSVSCVCAATTDDRKLAEDLSQSLTDELCGLELILDRAWFVQERHKLALALKGALDKVDMPFDCM